MQVSQESTCAGVFFNKVTDPQNCNFIKKKLQQRFSLVNYVNYSKTPFLCRGSINGWFQWLLLTVSGFATCNFIKKETPERRFSVSFAKLLRTSSDRITLDNSFLCLSVNFEKFFRPNFTRESLGNSLVHVQVTQLKPPDTIKSISQVLFKHLINET